MENAYTITPARYAKGMMAVRCPSTDGWKTRAARLAGYFARERYSGREHAYIMTRAAALRFEEHFRAGYDAGSIIRALHPPRAA
jgi:hypothetical protein